jgi:hypothetical protein
MSITSDTAKALTTSLLEIFIFIFPDSPAYST